MKGVKLAGEADPGPGRALHTGGECSREPLSLAHKQGSGYTRLPRQGRTMSTRSPGPDALAGTVYE